MGLTFNPFTGQLDFTGEGMSQAEADARYARLAAANIFTVAGASGTPSVTLSGSTFTGGSAESTKPTFLIEPAGTTSTGWSTDGTMFGLNAPTGFLGRYLSIQKEGAPLFSITSEGKFKWEAIGSFGQTPIFYVDGPYGKVEWWQGGDAGIRTFAPMQVASYFDVTKADDSASYTRITWDNTNTVFSSSTGHFAFGNAPMGTSDTIGFFCLRSCVGAPSGTPASVPSGGMPIVYDSSANTICVYNGGSWKSTLPLT